MADDDLPWHHGTHAWKTHDGYPRHQHSVNGALTIPTSGVLPREAKPPGTVTYTEHRLVRVQGGKRQVCARGSLEYVEASFIEFGAHTMPRSLADRFKTEPVSWVVESVRVTEVLLSRESKTEEQVQYARDVVGRRPVPEMFGREHQEERRTGQ